MGKINYKEIPAGNKSEGQDQFELFCRDLLEEIGFDILQHPSRGPDQGKDFIVFGSFDKGKKLKWLVSCKHNAHSNKSVTEKDEINPIERTSGHQCDGILFMFSTLASSGLSEMLYKIKDKLRSEIYDGNRIERLIIGKPELHNLFARYFTPSYEAYKKHLIVNPSISMPTVIRKNSIHKKTTTRKLSKTTSTGLVAVDFLRISKTALIIIETEKIKERFFQEDWDQRENILCELYKYSDHTNIDVADSVFDFLSSIAEQTRAGMTQPVATTLLSLTINFFPYSEEKKDDAKIIELANQCAYSAFGIVYDAAIYIKNYDIIMYGLTILKFIYKKGKSRNLKEIMDKVDEIYSDLERNLKRPERTDLKDALDLVLHFKDDRKEGTLSFPPLPEHLHKLIYSN